MVYRPRGLRPFSSSVVAVFSLTPVPVAPNFTARRKNGGKFSSCLLLKAHREYRVVGYDPGILSLENPVPSRIYPETALFLWVTRHEKK